ncbi:hypothetical protein Pmani_018506 [Petrolisthes manimaculis]|uniref:Uncharacterized protein n=1 Tax=Petrolisthes manimaculis TaxID=1843537 RepID=A0AAE1PK94_9EUCA|nr:hypothetical protein Pmani_018506 [Petrolisthes manimaculis]
MKATESNNDENTDSRVDVPSMRVDPASRVPRVVGGFPGQTSGQRSLSTKAASDCSWLQGWHVASFVPQLAGFLTHRWQREGLYSTSYYILYLGDSAHR